MDPEIEKQYRERFNIRKFQKYQKPPSLPYEVIENFIKEFSNMAYDKYFVWKLTDDVNKFIRQRLKDCVDLAWHDTREREYKGEYIDFLQDFDKGHLLGLNYTKYCSFILTGNPALITGEKKMFSKMAIYLNDSCNMNCRGCSVQKREQKPKVSFEEWKAIYDNCEEVTDFVVLFGGEPTINKDLEKHIKYLHKINLDYAIITNGKRLVEDDSYFEEFMSWKPRNITFSINHWLGYTDIKKNDNGFFQKTFYGYELLDKLEEFGYKEDLTANFTINRYTYKHLYEMIEEFTERGVWSILTPYHSMKGYFTDDGVDDLVVPITNDFLQDNEELNEQLRLIEKNYKTLLVHNLKEWFSWARGNMLKFNWRCNYDYMNYACIDSGGKIQACHNIRPSNLDFVDYVDGRKKYERGYIIDKNSEAYKQYMNDTKRAIERCDLCSLDHAWAADYYARNNLRQRAKEDFTHKRFRV